MSFAPLNNCFLGLALDCNFSTIVFCTVARGPETCGAVWSVAENSLDIDKLELWSWGCSDIHLETALKISTLQELTFMFTFFSCLVTGLNILHTVFEHWNFYCNQDE